MHAHRGDRLIVKGNTVGAKDRVGLVVDVRGTSGTPPYVVEWTDDPGEHLVWPGSNTLIESFDPHEQPTMPRSTRG